MNDSLEALLESAQVWRAREKGARPAGALGEVRSAVRARAANATSAESAASAAKAAVLSTGWLQLDAALPDGGWPLGTLIELLLPSHGVGELQLLLPALCVAGRGDASEPAIGSGEGQGWVVWVAPPLAPYPPALAQAGLDPARVLLVEADETRDRLWAMEQALHSRSCSAVLAWLDAVDGRWLRRLKLAAEAGRTLVVAFRPLARGRESSPAVLRLVLAPADGGVEVEILKGRGGPRRVGRVPVHADGIT